MQFRHPDSIRITSVEGGHVAIVGPEWRDLPVALHREALARGCECDQNTIRTQKMVHSNSEHAVREFDERDLMRKALVRMLERNDKDDFTGSGMPNLKVLAKEVGFRVNKEEALAVWHEMEVEALAAEGQPPVADAE